MPSGKGIVLAAVGLGAIALTLKAASAATSAPSANQQTYVDKTIAKATKPNATVTKAKTAAKKVTAEGQSAINAINKLLS